MGLAIGIGNGILFTSQRGVSSIIPGLLADLCARATYCENNTCTTATLEEIEAVRYTAPPLPVYTDNLVASYSFDTDFSDYTGNNDLTAFGSATAGVAGGKVSNCAELDGNSDYTIAADSDDFSFTNGTNDLPFSISFWANFDTVSQGGAGYTVVLSKRGHSNDFEYQFGFTSNLCFMNIFSQDNSDSISTQVSYTPTTGGTTWAHFTFTYNGNELFSGNKTYINGIEQTLINGSIGNYLGMKNTGSPITIGSGYRPNELEFDGKLDEFHIWKNRELTSAEVLDIYNTENAGNSIL